MATGIDKSLWLFKQYVGLYRKLFKMEGNDTEEWKKSFAQESSYKGSFGIIGTKLPGCFNTASPLPGSI